jgi:hypothetical protein
MENAIDLVSLSREFQYVEVARHVGEFLLQPPHVEVIRLQSAISDLQRQLAGQNREVCQLAEANGRIGTRSLRVCGERSTKSRTSSDTRARRSRGWRRGWRQIEGGMIKLSGTEEAVERAALGLAETKDQTSRVESDVAGLRAAMVDGGARVEEVRQKNARLKAELSDC